MRGVYAYMSLSPGDEGKAYRKAYIPSCIYHPAYLGSLGLRRHGKLRASATPVGETLVLAGIRWLLAGGDSAAARTRKGNSLSWLDTELLGA
jgi:hypothetical protein